MVKIETGSMEAAPLSHKQLENLLDAERIMNQEHVETGKNGEIYLLAVTRNRQKTPGR